MPRKVTDTRSRTLRLLVWVAGLIAVAMVAQTLVAAYQACTRGLPERFPTPVVGADVPILGVNVALGQYDDEELEAALARIVEGGFVWVRQSFYWHQIEPEPGRVDWTAPDRVLAALARYPQLRLVAVLDDSLPVPPADPDRFAAFAGAFATRYEAQVDHYQVWDEPNLAGRWGGGPVSPPAYADLLARTAQAIRRADPGARILLAGLAPTVEAGPQNLSDLRYLEQLYQAGAAPYFDVVAGKPYGFDTGPDDRRAGEAVLNFSRLLLLREMMVRHGDAGKALWASHWGWNALPLGWTGSPSLWGQTGEATQAAWTVVALERARAEWPWVGALILEHFQPAVDAHDPHWGFSLMSPGGEPRPAYQAVAAWAGAVPDGAPVGGYAAANSWTTYVGNWDVGPLGADVGSDGDRATFRFDGTDVAVMVRRGPYRALLFVTVDGEPANRLPRDEAGGAYIVLTDRGAAVVTVPLATGLDAGLHIVEVVAQRGQGQWALVSWHVGAEPVCDGAGWQLAGLVAAGLVLLALLVRDARHVEWTRVRNAFLRWPAWAQVTLTTGLTGVLWAAAANWDAAACWDADVIRGGKGLASGFRPWLFIGLLALPVLVALFAARLDLGLALVALAAPFYLHPGRMVYGALSLPEVLVVLCGAGLAVRSRGAGGHGGRGPRATLTLLDGGVGLLVLAAVCAGLFAADWGAALFELRTVFLFPVLTYGLLRLARVDEEARWRIVAGWVLGSVALALVGLVQYPLGTHVSLAEGGLPRMQSVYSSPNRVGLYLGRVWPILAAVAVWGVGRRRRVLYGLALVPVMLALLLSFSRGALLLGLPVALLVMGWRAGGRWRWVVLAVVVIGVLAFVPLLRVPRFASMLDLEQGSSFFRLALWRSSLALIREHPWFGVGPGQFQAAYRTRYILPGAWSEPDLGHPHNIYLDHWTRLGLLGLLAGLAVQVAFWRGVRPLSSPNGSKRERVPPGAAGRPAGLLIGLAGSMAALLAHGLVDNTLFYPDVALVFFLTLALVKDVLS